MENVVRAQTVVRGDRDADRAVDPRQLFHDEGVLHVAQAGPTVFLRKENAQQAQLSGLIQELAREFLRLVELHHVRTNLGFGELPHGLAQQLLFLGEFELHDGFPPAVGLR